MTRIARLALLFCLIALPSQAAPPQEPDEHAIVREVPDGQTLVLEDGREIRLTGILAPRLPHGRTAAAERPQPFAEEARAGLEALAKGRKVGLILKGLHKDRHGRQLAHALTEDGVWLQGQVLAQGLVRVVTFPENRAHAAEMLVAEAKAREAGLGLWRLPPYQVLKADHADGHDGSLQLVEGVIRSVVATKSRTYLNFGADYRSDFTISIDSAALKLFKQASVNLTMLEGRKVRVRGWLRSYHGPLLEASHPEQIEILE